ncbi:MAG: hypothetical protein ACT4PO_11180 [Actinomycetota bacterium]
MPDTHVQGRLVDGGAARALVAADFALGAGFGATATVAVAAGSTDRRGRITVTANGAGLAQATATVTLTFSEAFDPAPVAVACRAGGTGGVTEQLAAVSATTTALVLTHSVLPVAASTYIYDYVVNP